MKTERQMYEEYLDAQYKRLDELIEERAKVELDIDNVTTLMLNCPYEIQHKD
jgi:hypothetical protein